MSKNFFPIGERASYLRKSKTGRRSACLQDRYDDAKRTARRWDWLSGTARLCGKFDDYKTIDRPIHIRANKSSRLTWICMQKPARALRESSSGVCNLQTSRDAAVWFICTTVERACSCWKTSNIFQSEWSNRHSRFFHLHLENRSSHSHPARAKPFQPVDVYPGKRAVRRERAEIGEEWPAIEIQGKLHRARRKRPCDLWPLASRRRKMEGMNVDHGDELPRRD